MKVAKGYKQTDIGVLPEDWEVKKVNEISNVISGGTPSTFIKEYWGGKIKWMNSGELNLKRVHDVENRITDHGLKSSATKLIPANCILIGLAGQGKTRGTAAINYVELCTNQSIAAILPSNEIEPEYLYQNLDSRYNELRNESTGDGGRGGLNLRILKNLFIPVPAKDEQIAIANAMLEMDKLISSLENLIVKKQNIKQAAIQKLLSPRDHWDVKTYGDIFSFMNTATYSRAEITQGDEVNYIHYGDIHTRWTNILDFNNTELPSIPKGKIKSYTLIEEGDLIMADASEDYSGIGKCVEVRNLKNRKAISGLHTYLLRDTKGAFVNGFKGYLHECKYIKNQFDKLATGMKVYGVSKNNLKVVQISIPPKAEQYKIVIILNDLDFEIKILKTKLNKFKVLKKGMIKSLLTGKVRLV